MLAEAILCKCEKDNFCCMICNKVHHFDSKALNLIVRDRQSRASSCCVAQSHASIGVWIKKRAAGETPTGLRASACSVLSGAPNRPQTEMEPIR